MSNFLNYFYEWAKIDLKTVYEYKANIFFGFLITTINAIISIYVLFIFRTEIGVLLNWNFKEIVFFGLNLQFFNVFGGAFAMSKKLDLYLLSGDMNNYLVRPNSPFWQYFFATSKIRRVLVGIIYLFMLIIYAFLIKLNLFYFVLCFLFSLTGAILFCVTSSFFDSFAFFMKKNAFVVKTFKDINKFFRTYPYQFFTEFNFKYLLLFFTTIYTGSLATNLVFGYLKNLQIFFYWSIMFFIIIFLSFLTKLIWKIGLKKYEGFN